MHDKRKLFSIGYNHDCRSDLLDMCRLYKTHIRSVYFAWPSMGSGRGHTTSVTSRTEDDLILELFQDLSRICDLDISVDLLLNSSCFGELTSSTELMKKISYIIDACQANGVPIDSVTTMSTIVAEHVKNNYDHIMIKCSVNNHSCSSPRQLDILKNFYNGFYYNRDYNYDFETLKSVSDYCKHNNKELYLLANSGCFTDCPVRQLHQNTAAHMQEIISRQDNLIKNVALCGSYLEYEQNRIDYLSFSNIIRPEDICLWEDYVDVIKLATRASSNLREIVSAYVTRSYDGDLLSLTEPSHIFSYMPNIIDNKLIPNDYAKNRIRHQCGIKCNTCGHCSDVVKQALTTLTDVEWLQTHEQFLLHKSH